MNPDKCSKPQQLPRIDEANSQKDDLVDEEQELRRKMDRLRVKFLGNQGKH